MELETGLWIDGPDALAEVDGRVDGGPQGERVRQLISDGYTVFSLDDPARLDRAVSEIEGLWSTRPSEIAFARDSPAVPFSSVDESERQPSYRLQDVHSHSPAARSLYLDSKVHELIELLFGEPAVAIQSLYFEWGSQQVLHRDPVLVPTAKPGHLLAAWIALEDIHEDSGALAYVPGSHRYPYYEFAPGQFMYDSLSGTPEQVEQALAHDERQCRELGLETKLFTPRKGEVLIWHASLRHGGGPLRDRARTRRSLVVHFSTRSSYQQRANTIVVDGAPRVVETGELLWEDDRCGFQNPLIDSLQGP